VEIIKVRKERRSIMNHCDMQHGLALILT